jgi:hypothetical protein
MKVRGCLIVVIVLVIARPVTAQNVPDFGQIKFPKTLPVSPDGGIPFTVKVVTENGPAQGAKVVIQIRPSTEPLVCWGVDQTFPTLTGYTDADGLITFHVTGGGCVDGDATQPVALVYADNLTLGELSIVSPDAVNRAGLINTDPGFQFDAEGCTVSLADAVFHGNAIALGLQEPCVDIVSATAFNDYTVTVDSTDAAVLAPYLAGGISGASQEAGIGTMPNRQTQAVIALHGVPRPTHSPICASSVVTGLPCNAYTTDSLAVGVDHDMYLVVANAGSLYGIAGLSCGVTFDGSVAVKGWTLCADVDFASPGWPGVSGSGTRIAWASVHCQDTPLSSHGVHAVAGAFFVSAYADGELHITPNPAPESGPELLVADCGGAESVIQDGAAAVGFGTRSGRNPCLSVTPVRPTTWGRLKAIYRKRN